MISEVDHFIGQFKAPEGRRALVKADLIIRLNSITKTFVVVKNRSGPWIDELHHIDGPMFDILWQASYVKHKNMPEIRWFVRN